MHVYWIEAETHFNDADIGLLSCLVYRDLRYAFDPILDCVRDMRNNLRASSGDELDYNQSDDERTWTVFPK